MNRAAYTSCNVTTRVKFKKGKNLLSVRAVDAAGNVDATPASYTWKHRRPGSASSPMR